MVHALLPVVVSTLVLATVGMPMQDVMTPSVTEHTNEINKTPKLYNKDGTEMSIHPRVTNKEARFNLNKKPGSSRRRKARFISPSELEGKGVQAKDMSNLQVYVTNSKTGLGEVHDFTKHLPFPKDLHPDQEAQAFAALKQKSLEQGLSENEHRIKENHLATLYEGGNHLINDSKGVIVDSQGNIYSHHLDHTQAYRAFRHGHAREHNVNPEGYAHLHPSMQEKIKAASAKRREEQEILY